MVNWDSSFISGDAHQRSTGEPPAWHEVQVPVFSTRLVAKEKVCGWPEIEKLRKHLSASPNVDGRAWQDLFDIEQVLSRTEAVRLVPMR